MTTYEPKIEISATKISCIVSSFLSKQIKSQYKPKEVISTKMFLTEEEQAELNRLKQDSFSFIFRHGEAFEKETVNILINEYQGKYGAENLIITNYNDREEKKKILRCRKIGLSCIPDLLIEFKEGFTFNGKTLKPVIIEIKSSNYNTDLIESYKYQVASQGYLIAKEKKLNPCDFDYRIILQKSSFESDGLEKIRHSELHFLTIEATGKEWGDFEDVKPYLDDIKLALQRLWALYYTDEVKFEKLFKASFEELRALLPVSDRSIERFYLISGEEKVKEGLKFIDLTEEEKKVFADYIKFSETSKNIDFVLKAIKEKMDNFFIAKKLNDVLITHNLELYIEDEEEQLYKINCRFSKPVLHTAESKQKKIEEAQSIEVGSQARTSFITTSVKMITK